MKKNTLLFLASALGIGLASCDSKKDSSGHAAKAVDVIEYTEAGKSIHDLASQAVRGHKKPILYFYADWCGPCKRFRETLTSDEVATALTNAALIKVNIDSCADLGQAYTINAVPTFVKVDQQGNILAKIDGGKWGEDEPSEIAPVMDSLVNRTTYDLQ